MKFARIHVRQGLKERRRALPQFERIAAEKHQCACDASVSRPGSLSEHGIIGGDARRFRRGANHISFVERSQEQLPAARQYGRKHTGWRVTNKKKERLLRGLLENLEKSVCGVGIEFIDSVDDAHPPSLPSCSGAEERN